LAIRKNGFLSSSSTVERETFFDRAMGPLKDFIEVMEFKHLLYGLFPGLKSKKRYRYSEYFPNGWVASRKVPDTREEIIRRRSEDYFIDNRVSPQAIERVLRFTREWTKRGIRVYGLRPPVHEAAYEAENECSGLDMDKFVLDFNESGGIWLHTDQTGYHTYDGSHLSMEDAERFSTDLGRMIRDIRSRAGESDR
ncbi:MAG: hypothetical protein KJ645_01235, partial [Planctomycetes bacterium]|nr:hypothetical protein [Planctomycetota bacterium]